MKKYTSKLLINLDAELADWLTAKENQGYSKSGLVGRLLHEHMDTEGQAERSSTQPLRPSQKEKREKSVVPEPEEQETKIESLDSPMGAPTPVEPEPVIPDEEFDKVIRAYRSYPWMIEEIKDERVRAFVVEKIWEIEQKLTLRKTQQKERGWKNPYRKDYKPQLGAKRREDGNAQKWGQV